MIHLSWDYGYPTLLSSVCNSAPQKLTHPRSEELIKRTKLNEMNLIKVPGLESKVSLKKESWDEAEFTYLQKQGEKAVRHLQGMIWLYNNSLFFVLLPPWKESFSEWNIFQIFQNIFCGATQISLEESLWDHKTVNTGNPDLIKGDNMFFTSVCKKVLLIIPLWLHMSYPYKIRYHDPWKHQRKMNHVCRECLLCIPVLSKDAKW